MTTQNEIIEKLDLTADQTVKVKEAYEAVLKTKGEQDVELYDGTITPNLNKRLAGMVQAVKSVNGKDGDIVLSREDLNIPTDEQLARQEKQDRFVITESGRTQREKNRDTLSITDFYKRGDASMSEALNRAFLQTKSLYIPSDEFVFLQEHIINGDNLELWGDGLFVAKSLNFLKFTGNNIKINGISLEAYDSDSMINSKLLSVAGEGCKISNTRVNGNNRSAIGIETTGKLNKIISSKLYSFYSYNSSTQAIRSNTNLGSIIKDNEIWDLYSEKDAGSSATASSRAIYHGYNSAEIGNTIIKNNIIRDVYGVEGDAIHIIFNNGTAHLTAKTKVDSNDITNFSRRGIKVQSLGVKVRNNDVVNTLSKSDYPNLNTAIDMQYVSDCIVSNNTVETKEMACLQFYGGDTTESPRCKDNIVKDNTLKIKASSDLNSYALYMYKTDESVIKGNTISSNARGLAVADSSNNKVSDNEFFGGHVNSLGIYITPTSQNNVVKDNDGMNFTCTSFIRNQGQSNIIKDNYTKLGVCVEAAATALKSLYADNINASEVFTMSGSFDNQYIINGGFNTSEFSTAYATSFLVTQSPDIAYPNKRFSRGDRAINRLPSATTGSTLSWIATGNGVGVAANWIVEKVTS